MDSETDVTRDADLKRHNKKPETVTPRKVKTEDLSEEDPDEQNYHLWDLELI